MKNQGRLLIFSAPSGSGKTTIVKELMKRFPNLEFSISATSRSKRGRERNGVDYYFMSPDDFRVAIDEGRFVEWEEVYEGSYYGTLRSEMERIWAKGNVILFDVDVMGGIRLKETFGDNAISFFIKAPSAQELERRLRMRGTDSPEAIERRLAKAETETAMAGRFDHIVVNDDVERAADEICAIIKDFVA